MKDKKYQQFKNKTVLIAGSAGFIPGHLAELLLENGSCVIGLDNFITGQRSTINLLSKHQNFKFYEIDIAEKLPNFDSDRIDYIFNMASPASPIDFKRIPIEIMKTNSFGTFNLLLLAGQCKAKFLEASTSEVYGDPEIHPQKEDYNGNVNPLGPRSCYDESKRFAETLTMNYGKINNIETKIVRIFNTFGPRMRPDDGRVVPNFINQALNNKKLTIYGNGEQTRSFCYVDDLLDGILGAMLAEDNGPFNIGNPNEQTILQTAQIIIDTLQSSSQISFQDLPHKDDPKKRRPDITKSNTSFGFAPKTTFKEGIIKTAEYFKNL